MSLGKPPNTRDYGTPCLLIITSLGFPCHPLDSVMLVSIKLTFEVSFIKGIKKTLLVTGRSPMGQTAL